MMYKKVIGGIAILAIVFLACSSWAKSELPIPSGGERKSNPPPHHAKTQSKPAHDNRGSAESPIVVTVFDSPDAKNKADDDKKEALNHALSERRLVWFTFGLVLVGIIQAGIFLWQLILLSKSVSDTKNAADAAKASADAIPRVERAYLFLDWNIKKDISAKELEAPNPRISRLVYTFKNHGKTPAILQSIYVECAVFAKLPNRKASVQHSEVAGYAVGGAESSREFECSFLISKTEIERVKKGELHLFFFGFVRYKDIFGKPHETGFCGEYFFNSNSVLMYPADKKHNYYK